MTASRLHMLHSVSRGTRRDGLFGRYKRNAVRGYRLSLDPPLCLGCYGEGPWIDQMSSARTKAQVQWHSVNVSRKDLSLPRGYLGLTASPELTMYAPAHEDQ
jgi:hypothetical protein